MDEFPVETDIVGTALTVYYGEDMAETYYLSLRVEDVQEELDNTLSDPDYYPRFIHFDTVYGPRIYLDVNSIVSVEIERSVLVKGDLVADADRPVKIPVKPARPAAKKPPTKKVTGQ